MPERKDPIDWRMPIVWAAILTLSCLTRTFVSIADNARHGVATPWPHAFAVEATSHIVIAALIPAVYWMQRRFPWRTPRNFAPHVVALVVFSLLHTLGMAVLRQLWFADVLGEAFRFPLSPERFGYEFSKDIVTYAMINAGILGFSYLRERANPTRAEPPAGPPERFAVRKRGGTEVVVEITDIDWVEASGNYAILHVGGDTFEIRSSLAKLESELDPKCFVRVHKSHIVNISRVTEVTPWMSGDWRIRLQSGAEVNLSRRYRDRFEALAPVRT